MPVSFANAASVVVVAKRMDSSNSRSCCMITFVSTQHDLISCTVAIAYAVRLHGMGTDVYIVWSGSSCDTVELRAFYMG